MTQLHSNHERPHDYTAPFSPGGQQGLPVHYDDTIRGGVALQTQVLKSPNPAPATTSTQGPEAQRDTTPAAKNIVIFGETGVGKSSVINMIRDTSTDDAGPQKASVSSAAVGCTFSSSSYHATIDGQAYVLWDTAGLNEASRGTVDHETAVQQLSQLLHGTLQGQVYALVYCFRGKRLRQVIKDNYELFYRYVFRGQVPIVAVVTGLEAEEDDMERWWYDNLEDLRKYGLEFADHVCITASRGKTNKDGSFMYDEEYEASVTKVKDLFSRLPEVVAQHRQPASIRDTPRDAGENEDNGSLWQSCLRALQVPAKPPWWDKPMAGDRVEPEDYDEPDGLPSEQSTHQRYFGTPTRHRQAYRTRRRTNPTLEANS